MKKNWFEGSSIIECNIQDIKQASENPGEFHRNVTSFMPGLKSVELLEQGADYVLIKTDEGIMKRTDIKSKIEASRIIIEFHEEYDAGRMVKTNSYHSNEFSICEKGVHLQTIISEVSAPGILGFLYRLFGSNNIGNGILQSYKNYIESIY